MTCVSGARNSHEAALCPLLCHHTLLSLPFCKESWNGSRQDCPREMGGQQGRWNQCWNSFESHPSPPRCLRPRNTWLPGQVCQVTNPAITACRGHQEVDGLTLCLLLTPALPFPQRCASPGDGSPWLCARQAAQSLLFYVDKSLKQKETGFSSATLIMLTVCI